MTKTPERTQIPAHHETSARRSVEAAARLWVRVLRIKSLPIGQQLWGDAPAPTLRSFPFFGLRLVVDLSRSNAQRSLFLERERFVPEASIVRSLVVSGSGAIDVGANIGYFLLLLSSAGATPCVCVEPDPENLTELRRNIAENQMSDVKVFDAAAASSVGSASFRSGLNGALASDGDLEVRLIRIDDIAPDRVGLLKIDVEGAERDVLEGARRTLEEQRPSLFVEIHPSLVRREDDVRWILDCVSSLYENVFVASPREGGPILRRLSDRFRQLRLQPLDGFDPGGAARFWLVAVSPQTLSGRPG